MRKSYVNPHNPRRRSRAQMAATRKLVTMNRRRRKRVIHRKTRRGVTSFRGLPIRLLMRKGKRGAWITVAAFQGTPLGVKRAKLFARKYAAYERAPVRLIRV